MKLLIAYGTTEGQTRKICEYLRDQAKQKGHDVSLFDATGLDIDPEAFEAAAIGASLHGEKYQDSIKRYVEENHMALNKMPTAFLSVSLTAAIEESESWEELKHITEEFLESTGWKPTYIEQVAGALRYTEYNFFKKFIMRMIAQRSGGSTDTSKDHEYTNWDQVDRVLYRLEESVSKSSQEIKQ